MTESPGSASCRAATYKGDITESGFIHVELTMGWKYFISEHVIYAYVQNGEVTLYQSNSPTFYVAFDDVKH